jgi:hypothetical protein
MPGKQGVEALLGTTLTPDATDRDFVATFTAAEGPTPVRCTYQLTPAAVGRRLMVHFKLTTAMAYSSWRQVVEPLGEPRLSFPPLPRLSPGASEPRMFGNWEFTVNDATRLKLSRESETQDVTDVYVFWKTP